MRTTKCLRKRHTASGIERRKSENRKRKMVRRTPEKGTTEIERVRVRERKSTGTLGIQNMISPMNTPINAIDKIFIDSIEIDMSFMVRLALSFIWSVLFLEACVCHFLKLIFIRITSHHIYVRMYIVLCVILQHLYTFRNRIQIIWK